MECRRPGDRSYEFCSPGLFNFAGLEIGTVIKASFYLGEVSHVRGSSCDRQNWKSFWMKHTRSPFPKTCQIYGCSNDAKVGAHVYIHRANSNRICFILPTCQKCNMEEASNYSNSKSSLMPLKQNARLVVTKNPLAGPRQRKKIRTNVIQEIEVVEVQQDETPSFSCTIC